MADYQITEVEIDGQVVRVGDRIEFTTEDETHAGVVTEFFDDHEDGFGVAISDGFADEDEDLDEVARPVREISSVSRLPPPVTDDDLDEREAIVTEHFRTCWDRVLDGEEAP